MNESTRARSSIRMCLFRVTTALAALASSTAIASAAPTPSFMGLGTTSTCRFPTVAFGVSADGSTVVGRCQNNTGNGAFEAFQWSESTGLITLGDLPGGGYSSQSLGVSADGSVIVGTGRSSESGSSNVATRWTQASGLMSLGVLPGGQYSSSASAISDDGSVIVGFSSSSLNDQAYRWTAQIGMVGLGASRSYARGVSADGSVIVGEVGSLARPFRWTAQNGLVNLGLPPGGAIQAGALDVSGDGNTIVGYGFKSSGDSYAFAWRDGSGFQTLGMLPGDFTSVAREVSGDGNRIVGYSEGPGIAEAVIWDGAIGLRNLREWLVNDFDLNLNGWLLVDAYAISSDGNTIVGVGINPQGEQEAFRAVIPEPATAFLVLAAGLFVGTRRRRSSARLSMAGLAGLALFATSAAAASAAPTPSFMGLGTTSTCRFPTVAFGVSADGSTVVGRCQNNTGNGAFEGFRWSESTGLITLGDLPGGGYSSQSLGVSADGSVIVGTGRSSESGSSNVATRWTQASGLMSLGVLTGGQYTSTASAVSDNGSVIVGTSASSLNDQAYRWTAQEGMVGLGASRSYARGVSADGSVIVGEVGSLIRPFRWTAQSGLVNLGLPPGGANEASAQDVSSDGNTIVGYAVKPSGDSYAYLWREAVGFQSLGTLPNDTISVAREVSGDGSRVVGYSRRADFRAVLWDGANGIRDLREWLITDFGLNLTGWQLIDAYAISSDGNTIVGVGINPQGEQEAFRAVIPEPTTAFLTFTVLAVVRRSGLRVRR